MRSRFIFNNFDPSLPSGIPTRSVRGLTSFHDACRHQSAGGAVAPGRSLGFRVAQRTVPAGGTRAGPRTHSPAARAHCSSQWHSLPSCNRLRAHATECERRHVVRRAPAKRWACSERATRRATLEALGSPRRRTSYQRAAECHRLAAIGYIDPAGQADPHRALATECGGSHVYAYRRRGHEGSPSAMTVRSRTQGGAEPTSPERIAPPTSDDTHLHTNTATWATVRSQRR